MADDILIVDDEEPIRASLGGVLEDEGYAVRQAASGEEALDALDRDKPSLMFLDIWLPGLDGLAVLDRVVAKYPDLPVIMISGHGAVETAVAAIKKGAFDFIEKPLSLEKVLVAVKNALERARLKRENEYLRENLGQGHPSDLTGRSKAVELLRRQIAQVAPTDAWVLVTGQNGTGKEIVARLIHAGSKRAGRPLIAVNCAAIPEELIESELFGHEKGAFTGADRPQAGKFELADGGALFLDEIGDMSLKTQAKILRILQEQTFERVGGRKSIRVDARIIAATNKDLAAEIKAGRFREDLYYRLKVFPIEAPPLAERREDIELLLDDFLRSLARERGLAPPRFTPGAAAVLKQYPWPGNVRELKNFAERMFILHPGGEIGRDALPAEYLQPGAPRTALPDEAGDINDFKAAKAHFETAFLQAKLARYGGNVSRLAEAVGLERSHLHRKLKSLGISFSEDKAEGS
ncbi:MAG: sigma-54-dependent Fis family transcriptional regulator [Desulfovibrionaceae bacterium]|nr:sigma-54-dependent Fis family transcriptional regulator [Desulfovibrionaceae bacterium]MBF0512943.1 sigma-54-dependent Fis family transcriptional regulator [Desulfovibrionaceae bacterium]